MCACATSPLFLGIEVEGHSVSDSLFAALNSKMSEDIDVPKKTLPKYSLKEVSKHNTSQSLWLAVNGKVYDITKFMEEVSFHSTDLFFLG